MAAVEEMIAKQPDRPPNADRRKLIFIGHDVWISYYTGANEKVRLGFIEQHKRPDNGEWCMGSVLFDIPEAQRYRSKRADGSLTPVWTLVSLEPLHIEPSISCGVCKHHGFIRGGEWIPV